MFGNNRVFIFFAVAGSGAKYTYDRFPSNVRTEEQEEKRKQILAVASGASEYSTKHIPRYAFMHGYKNSFVVYLLLQCNLFFLLYFIFLPVHLLGEW